jgi:hypothetical protein
MYTYLFVGCDLLALVLQAIGGGMAATAKDKKGSDVGVKIMIAGLVSQVITMVMFLIIWLDVVLRTRRARLSGSLARTQPPLYDALRLTKKFQFFQWSKFHQFALHDQTNNIKVCSSPPFSSSSDVSTVSPNSGTASVAISPTMRLPS